MREYMDSDTVLRGEALSRSFGEGETRATVLHDLSLDLPRGQFVMLMGPSGSGKSTLLAVLSGLLSPSTGRVLARDRLADGKERVVDLWALGETQREQFRLRNCGYIFQGYNLFPALTARQQLEIVLRWGGNTPAREARRQSDEVLSLLGLAKKTHLLPAHLSGGEKQRVAIGRALVKNPTLCFADEPTSALDWSHGEHVIELLRTAAHERGATVLVVSHDPRMVPYADVVHHLEDGRLTDAESAAELEAAASR